jgi:hypothetical protein
VFVEKIIDNFTQPSTIYMIVAGGGPTVDGVIRNECVILYNLFSIKKVKPDVTIQNRDIKRRPESEKGCDDHGKDDNFLPFWNGDMRGLFDKILQGWLRGLGYQEEMICFFHANIMPIFLGNDLEFFVISGIP